MFPVSGVIRGVLPAIFMYMDALPTYMYVNYVPVWYLRRLERGVVSLELE